MKAYLTYKNRVQGFKDVSETVKTVEKIAASSVHFLEQEVASLRLYTSEIEKMLARLSLFYQKRDHPLMREKKVGKKALVVLTGDKGLVGDLWHKVINAFLKNTQHYPSVIVMGAKGKRYLKEEGVQYTKAFTQISDISNSQRTVLLADYIFDKFRKNDFSQVDILYPRFVSLVEQQPDFASFLPFKFDVRAKHGDDNKGSGQTASGLPIFEPSKKKIFNNLIQRYIGVFLHEIIIETNLSELSARTVAMEHAAVKTAELIQKLNLNYMKERRRAITQKQLESFSVHRIL